MPDMERQPRRRAVAVELAEFTELMGQRVEHQFGGDWCFSYVRWNYWFGQQLHRARGLSLRRIGGGEDGEGELRGEVLKNAACEISAGLSGKYLGSDGQMRPVGGDLNKVAYVPGLSQEALRLLQEARHIMGKLPGTSGVRTLARYRAKAMQVAYGAPVFVTLSPAEKHNYLMLRLARWRRTDPAVVQDPSLQKVAGRLQPGPEDRSAWPDFEERRQVLALKPAAAVLGFRVHVLLLLRAVFGIRTCLFCPACQSQKDAESFCSDLEGNASELVGGAFGRCAAAFFSIESQKSSALHVHGHVVIEGLQQVATLEELGQRIVAEGEAVVEAFLRFKQHVCMQEHAMPSRWDEGERARVEEAWPDYSEREDLLLLPQFFGDAVEEWGLTEEEMVSEGEVWKQKYRGDVQEVQMTRQHHIHPKDKKGERQPLAGCRKSENKSQCRAGYPMDSQVTSEGMVVCPGVAEKFGLALTGRRNSLGSLFGPRSCPWLNGSHPALLAAGRHNSDVQLSCRLPLCKQSHWSLCSKQCVEQVGAAELQRIAQAAMAAQIGYSTDYCTKRQAGSLYECREFARGHAAMSRKIAGEKSIPQVSRRHAQRIVADCFVRGIVRGAVETENLNMHAVATQWDPCAAECMQTFRTAVLPGAALLEVIERASEGKSLRGMKGNLQVVQGEVVLRDLALLYGLRGSEVAVAYLSPYEFVRYWEVKLVAVVGQEPGRWRRVVRFPESVEFPELSRMLGCIEGIAILVCIGACFRAYALRQVPRTVRGFAGLPGAEHMAVGCTPCSGVKKRLWNP